MPVPGSLPFSDTFTQADGTQLSRSWIERQGNFSVQAGVAQANAAPSLATADHAPVDNVTVHADVTVTTPGQYAGLVARFFGPSQMAMLFGVVMLSHQVGGFLGAYLGGKTFEWTGSYDWMWWADIVLAIGAALAHLPIDEKRPALAAQPA